MFGKPLGLHIIKFPSNRFGYVGSLPVCLAAEIPATEADILGCRCHRNEAGNLMAWKFPTFETEDAARTFAISKGVILSN